MAEKEGVDLRPQAWAFMFDNERCFEGTRTFSTQGINKAVFNLFKLYAKLGTDRLPLSSSRNLNPMDFADDYGTKEGPEIDGWATKKDDGSIQILIYCHHDDWDVKQDYQVTLNIDGLDCEYQIYHYRIDGEHSNAYTEWVRQGKPDYPTGAQYDAIKKRDGLELLEAPHTVKASRAKKLDFILPVHGISFIELIPLP